MQRIQEANGADEMRAKLPDTVALLDAERTATENAMRMANAACHYALSVNRAWIDLWRNRLNEYLELPKRFIDAQADFIEQAFDHYQESVQKLGSLAAKATRDAQAAGERVAHHQSDSKEMSRGTRPKENQMQNDGEDRDAGQQHSAH